MHARCADGAVEENRLHFLDLGIQAGHLAYVVSARRDLWEHAGLLSSLRLQCGTGLHMRDGLLRNRHAAEDGSACRASYQVLPMICSAGQNYNGRSQAKCDSYECSVRQGSTRAMLLVSSRHMASISSLSYQRNTKHVASATTEGLLLVLVSAWTYTMPATCVTYLRGKCVSTEGQKAHTW